MGVRSFADANVVHRVMRAAAATKTGRLVFRPTAHRLDQLVSKLTGGKRSFARIAAGLPAVILTTTGAKSGKPRTVVLMGIPHPDGVAIVATNYGDAKHPGWYYNLKTKSGEREEIWANGVEIFPGLAKERAWAGERVIDAFVLERS